MKKTRKFSVPIVALTTLILACVATFVVSGTLAKFTSTATAQSGAVPAAQFNFNEYYDEATDTFNPIVWNIENLGATTDTGYSNKVFYPGAYGAFSLDVNFISDVPAVAEATIDFINETGAFSTEIYANDPDIALRDLISLRFVIITKEQGTVPTEGEIDFVNNGLKLGEFEAALKSALEVTIGAEGKYTTLEQQINKTVYVYWNWEYEVDAGTNEMDTLFGNYVSAFLDDSIESMLGLSVTMTVSQDALDSSGEVVDDIEYTLAVDVAASSAATVGGSIAFVAVDGAQYGVSSDGGQNITWQVSRSFTGLTSATEYTFYLRIGTGAIEDSLVAFTSPDAAVVSIDYVNEKITYPAEYEVEVDVAGSFVAYTSNSTITSLIPDSSGDPENPASRIILVRMKAAGSTVAGAWTEVVIVERQAPPASAPTLSSKTATSITIVAEEGMEYRIDNDSSNMNSDWVTGEGTVVFSDLSSESNYYISSRYAASDAQHEFASGSSSSELEVTTD